MVERVQDITATAPVQKNCTSNHLEHTNPTSPIIPSAPSPGHIFYDSEDRSDLHFLVGREGWRFPAHSFIVGKLQNTLVALLDHAHQPGNHDPEVVGGPLVLRLPDVEPEVFKQMLRFIYTEQTSFSSVESTLQLLRASQTFHIPQLTERCLKHLSASVSTSNVLLILGHLVSSRKDNNEPAGDCRKQRPLSAENTENETNDYPVSSGGSATQAPSGASPTQLSCTTYPTQLPSGTSASPLSFGMHPAQLPFRTYPTRPPSETSPAQLPFRMHPSSGTYPSQLHPGTSAAAQSVVPKAGMARSVSENGYDARTLREHATRSSDVRISIPGGCACSQDCSRGCADDNVCCWIDNVRNELKLRCFQLVDSHADLVLASEAFETLEHPLLTDILRRDGLAVSSEPRVFDALMRWACCACKRTQRKLTPENKCAVLGDALLMVRYLTMTPEDFLRGPVSQGVLSREDKELFLARLTHRTNEPLPERWRDSKVGVARRKRRSPDRAPADSPLAEVQQPVVKSKKKSMSKKLLNGMGDLVICVIQLLD